MNYTNEEILNQIAADLARRDAAITKREAAVDKIINFFVMATVTLVIIFIYSMLPPITLK